MNDQICHHVVEANLRDTIEMMLFVFIGEGIAPQRSADKRIKMQSKRTGWGYNQYQFRGGINMQRGDGEL